MTDMVLNAKQKSKTINLKKYGAIAAIAFPILQIVSQGLIQVGGMEPSFAASSSEILQFFESRDPMLFTIGGYISVLSLVAFLWFLGALWDELRTAEGGSGWLSIIAIGSGLVTVSAMLGTGGWELANFRIGDGLDPESARLLFDEGNFTFAQIWVSLASMVLAVGLIARMSNRFPGWLSWSSIVLAIGLLLARLAWTTSAAFGPYVLFWVWMIVLGAIMLRQARREAN